MLLPVILKRKDLGIGKFGFGLMSVGFSVYMKLEDAWRYPVLGVIVLSSVLVDVGCFRGYWFVLIRHLLVGVLFITMGFTALIDIASYGMYYSIYFALIVWNSDTGALIAGRLGKLIYMKSNEVIPADVFSILIPKSMMNLVKKVSPNKTITGFFGGIALGTTTAIYLPALMDHKFMAYILTPMLHEDSTIHSLTGGKSESMLGLTLGILGIIGDLVESSIKRNAEQKDSGKLLPGHGGLMDRMDSMLLSAIAYSFILCNGNVERFD